MKWYKKQMDKLKVKKSEPSKSGAVSIAPKLGLKKKAFSSPVAARNRNRPKTDCY